MSLATRLNASIHSLLIAKKDLIIGLKRPFTSDHLNTKENADDPTYTFPLFEPFMTHRLDISNLPTSSTVRRSQAFSFLESMLTIRKMEQASDALYKAKLIRGFCHLSVGQESVAVGMEGALTDEDALITAYRCHGFTWTRGRQTIRSIIAELLGKSTGCSRGKGGSMHMYGRNFYGGNGIVGAQVPLGTGIAFAQKYQGQQAMTVTMYGDGAANQGQVFEVFNMAALMKLPVLFVCENNKYGMGTSAERAAASTDYFARGDFIPGLRVHGMDVLAVKEAITWARDWIIVQGNGPLVMEILTYRYHGHSMSDPGTSYRTRDEVQEMRNTKDPIKHLQQRIKEVGWATDNQLKDLDRAVKKEVDEAVEQAKSDPFPDPNTDLWSSIYAQDYNQHRGTTPIKID